MNQGAEEFFLGLSGDSTTQTSNGMSDLFYDGNDTIYHMSTGAAAMAGSMLTPYVNAQAAAQTAGTGTAAGSTAGKPAVTKPTVTEVAGGTADDALEQFDPVGEQAIAGTGGIEGGSSSVLDKLIDGSSMKTSDALDLASEFLGEGYTEPKPGGGSHVNFEFLEPNPTKPGKMQMTTDIHIFLED